MTAQTMPARPDEDDASLRPVPWRRMAGVTWRQHRIALAGVAVLLGALAVCLWIVGTSLHHAYAAAIACHPASSAACQGLVSTFNGMDNFLSNGFILQVLPVLIGAFVGAPVLARELETGTFRYAWTQGFGRWRWALAKLVLLAIAVTAAAGAFGALLSWYYQPYFAPATSPWAFTEMTPFFPACSACAGSRSPPGRWPPSRSAPWPGCSSAGSSPRSSPPWPSTPGSPSRPAGLLREHYLTPLVTTSNFEPARHRVDHQPVVDQGRQVRLRRLSPRQPPQPVLLFPSTGRGKPSVGTLAQCLAQHGYTQWTSYQPASRFWPFQWIEGGWLLALSVLLIAATIWLVRRRAA